MFDIGITTSAMSINTCPNSSRRLLLSTDAIEDSNSVMVSKLDSLYTEAVAAESELSILETFDDRDFLIVGGFTAWLLGYTSYYSDVDILFIGRGVKNNYATLNALEYRKLSGSELDGYCYKKGNIKFLECSCDFDWEQADLQVLLFEKLKQTDLSICMNAFNKKYFYTFNRSSLFSHIVLGSDSIQEAMELLHKSIDRLDKYKKRALCCSLDMLYSDSIFLSELRIQVNIKYKN